MKKQHFLLVALLFLIGVTFFLRPKSPDAKESSVKVAANLPLSGVLAVYGVSVREGSEFALKSGNLKHEFSIDWQDNRSEATTAVTVFQRQAMGDPRVYVSGVKPQTMAISEEVAQRGMPHFVWIFDAHINRVNSNNFRTWVSYKIEPPVYLQYAKALGAKKVAATWVQLPHAIEEFEEILIPELEKLDIAVARHPFEFGRKDFKNLAAKIAAEKADLIILNGFQNDLVGLVKALRGLDAISDGNTIATYDMLDAASLLGKELTEGIRVIAPHFVSRPKEVNRGAWIDLFQKEFGKRPLYTHAYAYDMIFALDIAASKLASPGSATHEEWRRALREVDGEGITGAIEFDSEGDLLTPVEVAVYRNGLLIPEAND